MKMRFQKKPEVIEAFQLTESAYSDPGQWPGWARETFGEQLLVFMAAGVVYVRTVNGTMITEVGDWVIKGVTGLRYPWKRDVFQQTYDPVD